jgi:hypothetical protein
MADERLDEGMIEIGDPTEEPKASEPAPQVVIQYHERGGVPWMLIPPLLVISAVLSVLLYHKFAPKQVQPHSIAKAIDAAEPIGSEPVPPVPPASIPSDPIAIANPEPKHEEPLPQLPLPSNPVEPTVSVPVPAPVEPAAEPVKTAESAPFPRVQGLGFDPKALAAERKVEAPADLALAPVAREERPDDRDLPREIDPDLLPPDPRQAKIRQQQRRLDALKKIDDERVLFHADLKKICTGAFRKSTAEKAGTAEKIEVLKQQYETRVDPSALKKAAQLLGKNGRFEGTDRRKRIELLRSLGFPELAILGDIFDTYGVKSINERDGPRSPDEALYYSALILIRNPPTRDALPSRAVSSTNESKSRTIPSPLRQPAGNNGPGSPR